jgi:hypothetical protein
MNKTLITGSGKCGTTFFVELLTELGFDTGFESGQVGSGEWNYMHSDAVLDGQPYIIKSPNFCKDSRILDMKERWGWHVDHVYVLLRDYDQVANNRWKRWRFKSGLPLIEDQEYKVTDTRWRDYKKKASRAIGYLMLQLISEDIPYTFLLFPRIIKDPEYLWSNCALLQTLDYETFKAGFDKVADTNKVHWGLKEES